MSEREQRRAAADFVEFWSGKGYEKGESQPFWLSLLRVLGVTHPERFITFEDKVKLDHTSFIDGYIPSTHVLIEQKGSHRDTREKIVQSDKTALTPLQQAKRYSMELPYSQRPRWIVVCNFTQFDVYDMEAPGSEPQTVLLENLGTEIHRLRFLVDDGTGITQAEKDLSLQAGELVGKIYEALLKQYKDPTNPESLRSLNQLCVRIVFCLYAEDAELFGEHQAFHNYLQRFEARGVRQALRDLFEVLNTPIEDRDDYLEEDLAAFPYVAGGLFADENVEIPRITDEIRTLILSRASEEFDWSKISPTIFGAVFESTLNPATRRAGGMHYTSVENIHKVIGPLFLNDLRAELDRILALQVPAVRDKQLRAFQDRLAGLRFLDPACGSGNFLTETYIQLRRLENEALRVLSRGQKALGFDEADPVKVKISQFYGIEINDFAVTVAMAALWIAESQMLHETEDIIERDIDFLPLKSNSNIHEGNALRMDWSTVIDPSELSYIMGNPPFIGSAKMNDVQKKEITELYAGRLSGSIDYVAGWYMKASEMMREHDIDTAFVSTNSITQGEQVAPMWGPLLEKGIRLFFAHRTFRWDSEAKEKAQIYCVIIGITYRPRKQCQLFTYKTVRSDPVMLKVSKLSPYLRDEDSILVQSSGSPLFTEHRLTKGNQPTDNGNFILTPEEKEEIEKKTPGLKPYIRWYLGAEDYLHSLTPVRYCLWLRDAPLNLIAKNKAVMERIENVRAFRAKSTAEPTRQKADCSREFFSNPQKDRPFLVVPRVSSENRVYVPMGFMPAEVIASDSLSIVANGDAYAFGVMSSIVHMAWLRAVAGRLKSDYRYSGAIVFNPFPWPKCTPEQRVAIEKASKAIIAARDPNQRLADQYNPLLMPKALKKAHEANDAAVLAAYGLPKNISEDDIVREMLRRYRDEKAALERRQAVDAAVLKVLGKNAETVPAWMTELRAQCLAGTITPDELITQGKAKKKADAAAARKAKKA